MLKLYAYHASPPSRTVMAYCELAGIQYEFVNVDLSKFENKGEEYSKINPFQLVPAIDDEGFKLAESPAIITYLAQTRKDTTFMPQDSKKKAFVHRYFGWHHSNTKLKCGPYFAAVYNSILKHRYDFKVEDTLPVFEKFLADFEEFFLKDTKFVAGDEMTAADIMAYCEIQQEVGLCSYNLKEKFGKVADWYERVSAVDGMGTIQKIISGIYENIKQFEGK
jgi:glutathione S-transferase